MKRARIAAMICATVAITASMVLARMGIMPIFVFYTLLIGLHIWIFARIGVKIYNLIKK